MCPFCCCIFCFSLYHIMVNKDEYIAFNLHRHDIPICAESAVKNNQLTLTLIAKLRVCWAPNQWSPSNDLCRLVGCQLTFKQSRPCLDVVYPISSRSSPSPFPGTGISDRTLNDVFFPSSHLFSLYARGRLIFASIRERYSSCCSVFNVSGSRLLNQVFWKNVATGFELTKISWGRKFWQMCWEYWEAIE